jgi:hypothetical protein
MMYGIAQGLLFCQLDSQNLLERLSPRVEEVSSGSQPGWFCGAKPRELVEFV